MTNFIHDYFFKLGFDEAAGNFQRKNISGFGFGNDEVQADAQDGWGTGQRNNANFYTPPDGGGTSGGKPRMQMYLFNSPRLADGDFDGDVIIHEYTHGLSNRLVGGAGNVTALGGIQSGAMGEGWGDWFAASIYNKPVFGEYVTGDTTKGIRMYALNNNPLTYGDICTGGVKGGPKTACEVHADGEIWSATLWDIRKVYIGKYGYAIGKKKVEQLVVDAMELSLPSPSMLDMRDAILLADFVDPDSKGSNLTMIWKVFAKRGMGWTAFTTDHNDMNPIEAFNIPGVFDSPDPISPNGDGVKDTTTISSNFLRFRTWNVIIKDSAGNIVKSCTGVGMAASCVWDGKNTVGQVLPDGVYSYTLEVKSVINNSMIPLASGTVTIDTASPSGSISIEGNNAWTKTSLVTLTLNCSDGSGSGCADMRLSNDGVFDTEPWEPFAVSKAWILSSVDGNKAVYLRYRDKAGNRSSMLVDWIKLDTVKPVITSVSDTPDPLRHHLGEVSTISFNISDNLSGTCKAVIKIFNPSAVLVRTILTTYNASCPVGGAAGSVIWDGKDTGGTLVPSGTYSYKVQAVDKALNWSFIKSGTITVE
ncbi:MAG: M36 family metallopeptidase [Nitrospirae bacterium]|nr:M36 family metallopeptidase [Nitrospirota bacterium]